MDKSNDSECEPAELKVLVSVEDNRFRKCLGKRGVVTEKTDAEALRMFWAGAECDSGKAVSVRVHGGKDFIKVPLRLLVSAAHLKPASPLSNYKHKSRDFKRHVLRKAGWMSPDGDIDIATSALQTPDEDHISIFFAHISWAVDNSDPKTFSKIGFVPTQITRTFEALSKLEKKDLEQLLGMQRIKSVCQRLLSQKDLIFVPIYSEGKNLGHYTLIILTRQSDNEWSIEYEETLKTEKLLATQKAQFAVSKIFEMPKLLPPRKNKIFQNDIECGYLVMHRMEDRVRQYYGQGEGTQGAGPDRVKDIRKILIDVTMALETERRKWDKETIAFSEKLQAIKEKADLEAAKAATLSIEIDEIQQRNEEMAKSSLSKGHNDTLRVSAPMDFAKPKAKAVPKAKSKNDTDEGKDETADVEHKTKDEKEIETEDKKAEEEKDEEPEDEEKKDDGHEKDDKHVDFDSDASCDEPAPVCLQGSLEDLKKSIEQKKAIEQEEAHAKAEQAEDEESIQSGLYSLPSCDDKAMDDEAGEDEKKVDGLQSEEDKDKTEEKNAAEKAHYDEAPEDEKKVDGLQSEEGKDKTEEENAAEDAHDDEATEDEKKVDGLISEEAKDETEEEKADKAAHAAETATDEMKDDGIKSEEGKDKTDDKNNADEAEAKDEIKESESAIDEDKKYITKAILEWTPTRFKQDQLKEMLSNLDELPQWRKEIIKDVCMHGLGLCGKCRWLNGCDKCSPDKCLRYHLTYEGAIARKLTARQLRAVEKSKAALIKQPKQGGGEDAYVTHYIFY